MENEDNQEDENKANLSRNEKISVFIFLFIVIEMNFAEYFLCNMALDSFVN